MTNTDPTISPHEPSTLLNRLEYHASRTPQFRELSEAVTRIRELEAKVERARNEVDAVNASHATLARFLADKQRVNEKLREFVAWVDAWVSNPATSYSVSAIDGLFGMTRDRLAALNSTDTALATAECDGGE